MKLTFLNRLRLCFEILTAKSGHAHPAQEKQLSTFIRGLNRVINKLSEDTNNGIETKSL